MSPEKLPLPIPSFSLLHSHRSFRLHTFTITVAWLYLDGDNTNPVHLFSSTLLFSSVYFIFVTINSFWLSLKHVHPTVTS